MLEIYAQEEFFNQYAHMNRSQGLDHMGERKQL